MGKKPHKKTDESTLSVLQLKQLIECSRFGSKDRLKTLVCCKDATHGLEGIWDLEGGTIPEHVEWAAYILRPDGKEALLILDGEKWIEIEVE